MENKLACEVLEGYNQLSEQDGASLLRALELHYGKRIALTEDGLKQLRAEELEQIQAMIQGIRLTRDHVPDISKAYEDLKVKELPGRVSFGRIEFDANGAAEEELQSCVHIIFSLSDAGSLKVALSKLGNRKAFQVLAFNDLFSIGPITGLDTSEGQQNRLLWLLEHDGYYRHASNDNREHQIERMIEAIRAIPEHKSIVIWHGDNAHDQTGLRFAMHLLRDREQPVHAVNVTELALEMGIPREEGTVPYAMGQIDKETYRDIVARHQHGCPMEPEQRRRYESEWLELTGQDHLLRLWEAGAIRCCGVDELDSLILEAVTELQDLGIDDGYVKAGIVVVRVWNKSQQVVGDSFIAYRIWSLISDGVLAFRGLPWAVHQYAVRLA